MNIYIVQGGIGKHVMFSALIEKLAEKSGDKIIVVSAYPELFKYHPKVEISATFHEPGFYDKYVKNTDHNVISNDPYYSNYVRGKTHLIEEWAKLYDVEYATDLPDIYVDDFAIEECERFINHNPQFIITQFSGGQSPIDMDPNRPHVSMGQIKDYPRELAQKLVNNIKEKNPDMVILNYALPNEQTYNLENCIHIEAPFLFYVALLHYCKAFISIDSSLQHFAANRHNGKRGVVLWGSTSPTCLGYGENINLANNKDGNYTMRPLCNPLGDLFNKDGSQWVNEDVKCIEIDPQLIMQKLDDIIKYNDTVKDEMKNISKNTDIIEVNEKTQKMLFALEGQMRELDTKYRTVIDSYIAANDKDGQYNLSSDGKRLVKAR